MHRRSVVAAVVALAAIVAVNLAKGSPSAGLPGLPRDIDSFQRWPRLSFKPLPDRGGTAHQGVKQVYVNKRRSVLAPRGKQRFPYPAGTIVVKTASTGGVITLVAIGRKLKGFDRAHGDWQFVEYKRSSSGQRFTEISRGAICYSCHVGAKRTDWIFTRAR
jgi:Cytochrome P460